MKRLCPARAMESSKFTGAGATRLTLAEGAVAGGAVWAAGAARTAAAGAGAGAGGAVAGAEGMTALVQPASTARVTDTDHLRECRRCGFMRAILPC